MTKEGAIASLQSEIDECKEVAVSTGEQYRSMDCSECARAKAMIEVLNRCTEWTPCSERMPTKEDGGGKPNGLVNVKFVDGTITFMDWQQVALWKFIIAWSRIEKGGGNG